MLFFLFRWLKLLILEIIHYCDLFMIVVHRGNCFDFNFSFNAFLGQWYLLRVVLKAKKVSTLFRFFYFSVPLLNMWSWNGSWKLSNSEQNFFFLAVMSHGLSSLFRLKRENSLFESLFASFSLSFYFTSRACIIKCIDMKLTS